MENEIEELVKQRIKENEKLFNEEELIILKNNTYLMNKVYFLGVLDIVYKSRCVK